MDHPVDDPTAHFQWIFWRTGPDHQATHHAIVRFGAGEVIGHGQGSTRRKAKKEAAAEALQHMHLQTGLLHPPETIYDMRERMIDWEGIFNYPVPYPAPGSS